MQLPRRPALDALTGLRFFAAMHVVFYHFLTFVPGFRNSAPDWLRRLVAAAPSEVDWFFVLSGFILTYNYMGPDARLSVSNKEFWTARFARVYPIYLLGMLVYLPIATARYFSGTGLSVVDIGPGPTFAISGIVSLFLVQSWTVVFSAWNAPAWSVSAEAFFYSIFPWVAPRIMSLSPRRMLLVTGTLWLISLLGPMYFLIAILDHGSKQTKELWEVALEIHPLLRVIAFLVGITTGVLFLRKRGTGSPRYPMYLNITMLAIVVLWVSVPTDAGRLLESGLTPLFALLIYLLAFGRGFVYKLLTHPVVMLLGEASYALYILHNPLWNFVARLSNIYSFVFRGHFPTGPSKPGITTEWNYEMSGWTFCVYLILLVGSSLLAVRYIERPARTYLLRRFRHKDRTRPEPEASVMTAQTSS